MTVKNAGTLGTIPGRGVSGIPVLPIAPVTGGGVVAPGGSTAAFLPSDLANLHLWLRADLGVFQEDTFATASGDGDVIGGWRDQSANGFDVTQGTTANKPLLDVDLIGGQPAAVFEGTNDQIQNVAFTLAVTAFTIYTVVKIDTYATDDAVFAFADATNNDFTNKDGLSVAMRVTASRLRLFQTGGLDVSIANDTSPHIVITQLDGASTGSVWIDDGVASTDTYVGSTVSSTRVKLAERYNSGNNGDLNIAELIMYTGAHDADTRTQVLNYLNGRYGIF